MYVHTTHVTIDTGMRQTRLFACCANYVRNSLRHLTKKFILKDQYLVWMEQMKRILLYTFLLWQLNHFLEAVNKILNGSAMDPETEVGRPGGICFDLMSGNMCPSMVWGLHNSNRRVIYHHHWLMVSLDKPHILKHIKLLHNC